jgi:hypothetical protein
MSPVVVGFIIGVLTTLGVSAAVVAALLLVAPAVEDE